MKVKFEFRNCLDCPFSMEESDDDLTGCKLSCNVYTKNYISLQKIPIGCPLKEFNTNGKLG